MRRCLVVLSLVAVALAAAGPAGAKAFSKTDSFFTADDGVQLAVSYYEPTDLARPAAGFPAVMVFHGLGGSRTSVAPVAETFAANGIPEDCAAQRAPPPRDSPHAPMWAASTPGRAASSCE